MNLFVEIKLEKQIVKKTPRVFMESKVHQVLTRIVRFGKSDLISMIF